MTRRSLFALTGAAAMPLRSAAPSGGRLKQAVCKWCYSKIPFDTLCRESARMGIKGVDLIGPEDWPTAKKYGLVPSMVPSASNIKDGINRKENHERIEKGTRESIARAAEIGAPNVIVLSGVRAGMRDEEGMDNSILFFNKIKSYAEDKNVTLCLELLNSKINHPDYMCDHTKWGVDVCKRVNSPRVKLLYDIYHMQIMEGDVLRTVKENLTWIGHFHTGGNPGRHELDDTQELNYRGIAKAIADMGYTGYFAHEFIPVRDPLKSMEEAVRLCEV
jgi:hydroxypyruvate isomerase